MNPVNTKRIKATSVARISLALVCGLTLSACVTSRIEDSRQEVTGLKEGEGVVIMAKSYHLGNETENKFISCVGEAIGRGSTGLRVVPNLEFVDALFPWFEPRTAPADTKGLPDLMARPGVAEMIADKGVRYVVWLDGDTERVGGGGSLSCAAGPGGGGCFGFAWWQNDANYEASVWDLSGLEDAGTISADYSGTSFLPALIVPIPLVARTQAKACKGLSDQLKLFIVDEAVL
jgi:hypothetical protein